MNSQETDSLKNSTATNDSVFRTRIDAWLVMLLGAALALCFHQAWSLRGVSPGGSMAALGIGIVSVVTVFALTVPCRYTLKKDYLFIRCGIITKCIPYLQVNGIELSSSPLSAPALSLRRVRIAYGRSFALVSPLDRDRFVDELVRRCNLNA